MAMSLPHRDPERGAVYRDVDGQLVRLVKVTKNLCTWEPISEAAAAPEVTHRDNFVRRFRALKTSYRKAAA